MVAPRMTNPSPPPVVRGTVFHVEHDPLAVALVRQVTDRHPATVRHVGVASTGRQGIDACRLKKPDIALLGLTMPDMDGFTVAEELAKFDPPPRAILLTSSADEVMYFQIGRGRVVGVVWKTPDAHGDLLAAFNAVLSGRTYFPAGVDEAVKINRRRLDAFGKVLSDRELELLPLIGRGLTDKEVAAQAGISAATAHTHRHRIMAKLNLHTTSDLMRWAAAKGFVRVALPAAPCCVSA